MNFKLGEITITMSYDEFVDMVVYHAHDSDEYIIPNNHELGLSKLEADPTSGENGLITIMLS